MNRIFKRSAASLAVLISIYVIVPPSISAAATKVDLSTASSFGALGALGVANTGPTAITGTAGNMVGTSGAIIATGFPPGTAGTIHNNDAVVTSAVTSVNAAVTAALAQPSVAHVLVPFETVTPGVYALGSMPVLSGALTLNGGGDANSVFVFTTNDAFVTATSSVVNLINGAQAANVFWRVGGTAILGTNSKFAGHLVASSTVTALMGATVMGSLISQTGAVSLNSNMITNDLATPAVVIVLPLPGTTQTSRIDSITPTACATTGPTTVTLNGVFPTAVTTINVNGTNILPTSWSQTPTSIVISNSVNSASPVMIQVYNGLAPALPVQSSLCIPVATVPPVVVPPVVVPPVVVPPVVVPPVVVPPVTEENPPLPGTKGTINVITVVNNTYGGTATPGDFTLALRHHAVDVLGSPAVGMAAPGRSYLVNPGTYVLTQAVNTMFPDYIQSFDIVGQSTQNVVLQPGQTITITETNNQLPPLTAPVTGTTPPPPAPPTETGGKLPKTGSPWFNLLLLGIVGMGLSGTALGFTRRSKI